MTNETKSRKEERFQSRIKQEVDQIYHIMTDKFTRAIIISDDPEGKEIVDLAETLDAQWRLLCKRKNLVPSIYPAMKKFLEGIMKEYTDLKNEKENTQETSIEAQASKAD